VTEPAVAERPELRVPLLSPLAAFGAWLVAQLIGAVVLQGLHGTVPEGDRLFDPYFALLLLGADVVLLGAVGWIVRASPDWRSSLGLVRPDSWGHAAKLGFGGMVLVLVVAQILEPLLHAAESQGLTPRAFPGGAEAWIGVVVAFVAFVLVAPLAEELFFRGLLFAALRGRLGPHWTPVVTGVIFGALHGEPRAFISLALLGIVLGVLYERTGSVIPGVILHATNNGLAFAFAFAS
jgi:membrane protease YdiL (CAAX protease family)